MRMHARARRAHRERQEPSLRSDLRRVAVELATQCGAAGIAVGWKQTDGKVLTDSDKPCIAFFVQAKLPLAGQATRLSDGRRKIPKQIAVAGRRFDTDVIAPRPSRAWRRQSGSACPAATPNRILAGTAISDGHQYGTIGVFVRSALAEGVFALTARHIAHSPGSNLYIPKAIAGAVVGRTSLALDTVPDSGFFGFDTDFTTVDVDAALVKIPTAQLHRLDNRIGQLGTPEGFFDSTAASENAYLSKMLKQRAITWNWQSLEKRGDVTHCFYTVPNAHFGAKTFGLIVQGPGVIGRPTDSGKVWLTSDENGVSILGLHKGIAMVTDPTRAIVTDAGALARAWRLSVWSA